jgi:hypothetical protein
MESLTAAQQLALRDPQTLTMQQHTAPTLASTAYGIPSKLSRGRQNLTATRFLGGNLASWNYSSTTVRPVNTLFPSYFVSFFLTN